MKERGILFSAPMVRALLGGTKSQTRRPVKRTALEWLGDSGFTPEFVAMPENHLCPFGFAGDRLWVRETFFAFGRWETRFDVKKGRDAWHFVDMTIEADRLYQFSDPTPTVRRKRAGATPAWWRRPAIFMPRIASRITLEITDVRVERLQDISEADAVAEGCPNSLHLSGGRFANENYAHLWDTINGDGAWDTNPWVWVVEFRQCDFRVLESVSATTRPCRDKTSSDTATEAQPLP